MYIFIKYLKNKFIRFFLSNIILRRERKLFIKSSKDKKANQERDILLLVHALEKGMSLSNVKRGYGEEKAVKLITLINSYVNYSDVDKYVINYGISILQTYIDFQKKNNCQELSEKIYNLYMKLKEKIEIKMIDTDEFFQSGYFYYEKTDDKKIKELDFASLTRNRHSVRTSSDKEVDISKIEEAISIARNYPSACNRQPCKVYCTKNREVINEIRKMIPGNSGFENELDNFLIVTAKRNYFGVNEMFQWYINGGIFVAYLILALKSLNIGSCVFQWPLMNKNDLVLKNIMNIDQNECIINLIGIGIEKNKYKCVVASRKEVNDILTLSR